MTQRLWVDADPVGHSGHLMLDDILKACPSMARVMELAARAAKLSIPVIVEGEKGLGKEMVARAIHAASDRAHSALITLDCTTTPPHLIEAALFDYHGAEKQNGKILAANGATLYLDNIGDLPLKAQQRLLRFIERGEIEIPGMARPQKVNTRLILATGRDLIAAVKSGQFREDLYYRLNVFPIVIPALRRRREEISALALAFCARLAKHAQSLEFSSQALALLTHYDWPGNIDQLEATIATAFEQSGNSTLTVADFSEIAAKLPGLAKPDMENDRLDLDEDGVSGMKLYEPPLMLMAHREPMSRILPRIYRKLKDYGINPNDPLKEAARQG